MTGGTTRPKSKLRKRLRVLFRFGDKWFLSTKTGEENYDDDALDVL